MNIKYLVMDVDGTLTDGKIYMGESGELFKAFDVKDGYGINVLLPQVGIKPVIITGRKSKILENRCKEIGIKHLFQGVSNKLSVLEEFILSENTSYSRLAYIGDDMNDYDCINIIKNNNGLIGCPCDAVDDIRGISDFVSAKKGGTGAVREFIEMIIGEIRNEDDKTT